MSASTSSAGSQRDANVQGVLHVFVNLHDGGLVAAAVAIVGCREDGHDVPVMGPVAAWARAGTGDRIRQVSSSRVRQREDRTSDAQALHDELMRARHECQAVVVVERFRDVLTKRVPCSARRDPPSAPVVRVGPQQVAHRPFVRDLLDAVD